VGLVEVDGARAELLVDHPDDRSGGERRQVLGGNTVDMRDGTTLFG